MHPAYSVILFTTASGAGYGLLFWLAALGAAGVVPPERGLGLWGLGLALGLITIGLLSSTAHLGRPERAWRAFSQWRSSWLSREGVAAMATYIPACLLGIGWVFYSSLTGPWGALAVLAAVLALVTVWCTGMIYQSLPTIRAWSLPMVAPTYVVLALATGGVLTVFLLRVFGYQPTGLAWTSAGLVAVSMIIKLGYWKIVDEQLEQPAAADATGLGRFGTVRPLEPAHTAPNFVMREMGYQVARKHAVRLRSMALWLGFGGAGLATLISIFVPSTVALVFAAVAVLAAAFGVVLERWLFFAEARHVVTAYYRADAA